MKPSGPGPGRTPVTAFIALGANWGEPLPALRQAVQAMRAWPCGEALACSGLYRTAPHQAQGPDFLNAVVRIQTPWTAPDLLQALWALEGAAGRQRPYRHAPRTLDLDLLLYGHARIDSAALTVPHPRMHSRAFVLRPLADVGPEWVDPGQWARVADQAVALQQEGAWA